MKGGIVFSRNTDAAHAFENVSRAVLAKQGNQAAGCIPDRSAAGGHEEVMCVRWVGQRRAYLRAHPASTKALQVKFSNTNTSLFDFLLQFWLVAGGHGTQAAGQKKLTGIISTYETETGFN